MLWEVSLQTKPDLPDPLWLSIQGILESLRPWLQRELHWSLPADPIRCDRGYWLVGSLSESTVRHLADTFFADPMIETSQVHAFTPGALSADQATVLTPSVVTVFCKPGVMDPVAHSIFETLAGQGLDLDQIRTFRRYFLPSDTPQPVCEALAQRVFANPVIEQVQFGAFHPDEWTASHLYSFQLMTVPIADMSDEELMQYSRKHQLGLDLNELQTLRSLYLALDRSPTDVEIETFAQTWSEHCSHKTFRDPCRLDGVESAAGLLKDTIMRVTQTLNRDWCISVFKDNAGIIRFTDDWCVCFKVETHNHPSAIEPYGGANTGLGGVIRDILGAGLGAKPICNTDVFCVAPPELPHEALPPGTLHPKRVLQGIVAGVRDYGNRMGIPTVNGALCVHPRYVGNPLVYCGTVGLLPASMAFGEPKPHDLIVVLGGRTGRDGIHGATFSSEELTQESEVLSGGAVQIGNPITQKKLMDVLLQARDLGLFRAVTDCGAGGLSSAVGEMGADIGATVDLERVPLKYEGLSYTEIWISESQERMVLAVPPSRWYELQELAAAEEVEVAAIGTFEPTSRLLLMYHGAEVCDLPMMFLHRGRPAVIRDGTTNQKQISEWRGGGSDAILPFGSSHPNSEHTTETASAFKHELSAGELLHQMLRSYNIASKEWIIRQYDHEVQAGTIIKPCVGVDQGGPSDAAVIRPLFDSWRGLAIGCGINPHYGDIDPYRMAASAIDEALRNVVAVGGDPQYTALLDNFCWGNTRRPEVFGTLCQAAYACRDVALAFGTPFISGKDSLNNEFTHGQQRVVIPPTLLISALAIVPDIRHCVTMDFKEADNHLVLVGETAAEWGGSHYQLLTGGSGGNVPDVDLNLAPKMFAAIHHLIQQGWLRSCHDLSEGGLAVSLAEMAFAGQLGAQVDLAAMPTRSSAALETTALLFAESNSRFVIEVRPAQRDLVLEYLSDQSIPFGELGRVISEPRLQIQADSASAMLIDEAITDLQQSWRQPLDW